MIWSCWCHKVLNVGRSWILLMWPVDFAPTITCSMAMVYFTMAAWWFQLCQESPLSADIVFSHVNSLVIVVVRWCLHSALSYSWQSDNCGDNIRRSLCRLLCSAVITADLKVFEGFFQNQRLLVIILLIDLLAKGSVYLWLRFVRTYNTFCVLWWVQNFYILLWVCGIVPINAMFLGRPVLWFVERDACFIVKFVWSGHIHILLV